MNVSSGFVLFAVIWFMVFFVVLPLRLKTQGEDGNIVPGTHSSAPADPQMWRRAKLTTIWAIGLWILIGGTIMSGAISVRDIDILNRMGPPSSVDVN
ncbi:DUF1467 family protein [Meridianimarinicoccus aquatilis]|uniref:DUF1467 family protein n=1 Tax=Meridianimarinicoccus aquatilis TaxID=2552766 RepID=A0A4R6ALU7_9RHOB|nr:DUF1467 family protein [Fluviibacterium aquatile]TDL84405.1 DUF1467 family protein [Fluviibacterium aquatile]